jgi:hypothetical protein
VKTLFEKVLSGFDDRDSGTVKNPMLNGYPSKTLRQKLNDIDIAMQWDRHPAPETRVKIKDIIVTQEWIYPNKVEEYEEDSKFRDDPISLAGINGKLYLVDGNHRLNAAHNCNAKTIKAIIKDGND